ncbi:RNA/RNP complex-1-interacting phosphatase-like [Fundulus diaphanus]
MSRPHRKNDIPDRWQDYTAVGKRLKGTRFIAFKVPLKQALTRMLPSAEVFGPWELMDALKQDDQELGLIIDLTFTTRYYKLQDVPQSLLCVKIFTAGHEVPSDATILSFKRAVHRFLQDNKDNDKLIGVHCTHGLNRTGYLICRYLIDVEGMDPAEAVHLFNSSRGHTIERQNYLEDLHHGPKRSNQGIEESELEPQRGQAVHRHTFTASLNRADTQAGFSNPWHYRSHPPQGPIHRSHPYPHQHAYPARPPLLAHPPLGVPSSASYHPYRWPPLHPDGQRRRPSNPEKNRSRYHLPPDPQWHTSYAFQDKAGAPPPFLQRYSPNWTSGPNGGRSAEDWSRPIMGQTVRSAQRHIGNGYEEY